MKLNIILINKTKAILYKNNFEQFKKLAEEWTIKFATEYKIEEIKKKKKNYRPSIRRYEYRNKYS